jgi:hypothetical protein
VADRAYGLWPLVILNTAQFAVFAASFFHPRTSRDYREGTLRFAAAVPAGASVELRITGLPAEAVATLAAP